MAKRRGGLVYSTDRGRICPGCQRPLSDCICNDRSRDRTRIRAGDGKVTISRETKGRKGAGVTLIGGLPLADQDILKLAKLLKSKCGVGGSVKDGVIELQGDQREKARQLLASDGYEVRMSGG